MLVCFLVFGFLFCWFLQWSYQLHLLLIVYVPNYVGIKSSLRFYLFQWTHLNMRRHWLMSTIIYIEQ